MVDGKEICQDSLATIGIEGDLKHKSTFLFLINISQKWFMDNAFI